MGSNSSQNSSLILSMMYCQMSIAKVHNQTVMIELSQKKYEMKFPSYICKDKNNQISYC